MTTPELSRLIPADRVGAGGYSVVVEAADEELAGIARRLMVPSVEAVRCEWRLRAAPRGVIEAEGSLLARLHQDCVVSLDPFATRVVEEFAVRFVAESDAEVASDDPDEPDELPIVDGMLQLGEATVEQLALALDPYPRKPGAELPAEVVDTAENPFSALAKMRKPD